MDFVTAHQAAKARFAAHPFWHGAFTGTPLGNDVPVIAAELMREAYTAGLQRAAAIAGQHADTYESALAGGLVDEGLRMKAAEARTLQSLCLGAQTNAA